jgi:hypothetical protein
MPKYRTLQAPPAIYPGDSYDVIKAEKPAADEASERVALALGDFSLAAKFSVQIKFDADPGAFEMTIQMSDTDSDEYYVDDPTTIASVNENFVARIEFPNTATTKFVRLKTKTPNANNVNCTATITR